MLVIGGDGLPAEAFPFRPARKRPITVGACELWDDCEVRTLEGVMHGKKGDYLMLGVAGELYVCDRQIFEKTYRWVKAK